MLDNKGSWRRQAEGSFPYRLEDVSLSTLGGSNNCDKILAGLDNDGTEVMTFSLSLSVVAQSCN